MIPYEPTHVLFVPSHAGAVQAALREVTRLGRDYAPFCVDSVDQARELMRDRSMMRRGARDASGVGPQSA